MDFKFRRLLLLVTFALVGLLIVSGASAFLYFVTPVNNTINTDQTAIFQLTISNPLDVEDYFTLSTRDVDWVLTASPASGAVPPKTDSTFTIQLQPKSTVESSRIYLVPVKIRSEQTSTFQEDGRKFAVFVGPFKNQVYQATITPSVSIDKLVDPREKIAVKINLRNRNPKSLENLSISIDGGDFQKTFEVDLLPLEDKTIEVLFEVDPLLAPGKRSLSLIAQHEGNVVAESSTEYEVLGYIDMQETPQVRKSLFRTENTITIYNNGNKIGPAQHAFQMNFFERIFTGFTPSAQKTKGSDGLTYYVVQKDLGPKETLTITEVTDFRLLIAIIAAIIISTILYFVLRSPIVLSKTAEPIGRTSDGLSEIKVRIFVKNRSKKHVSNVRIIDTIPSIAEMKKNTHLGSMDPLNISKGKRGTIARWEFDQLEPFEERIISYKIESKLKLIGGIRLPNAKARFDTKRGKERLTFSNSINMLHKGESQ